MQKNVCRAMVAALACSAAVAVVGAQNPSSSAPQTASSKSTDKITVTGCLQRADQTATGTSGTAGAMSDASTKFILSNVTAKSDATSTAGTSGTSSSSIASSYRLVADDSKVSSHVGHKVEITGTPESASTSGSAASPSTPTATPSAPKLKVDSVTMISPTCP